ncbi:hypothetical protein BH11BAC4_BH11BAC4_16600 [soil metagenome]
MLKTIKATLLITFQRVKIASLKNKIRRMERSSYLNLSERIELRDAINSLQAIEGSYHNSAMFSM